MAGLSYCELITLRDDLKTVSQQMSSSISSLRHTSTAISRLKADVLKVRQCSQFFRITFLYKEEKNAGIAHKTSEHGLSIKNDNNELTRYTVINKLF